MSMTNGIMTEQKFDELKRFIANNKNETLVGIARKFGWSESVTRNVNRIDTFRQYKDYQNKYREPRIEKTNKKRVFPNGHMNETKFDMLKWTIGVHPRLNAQRIAEITKWDRSTIYYAKKSNTYKEYKKIKGQTVMVAENLAKQYGKAKADVIDKNIQEALFQESAQKENLKPKIVGKIIIQITRAQAELIVRDKLLENGYKFDEVELINNDW